MSYDVPPDVLDELDKYPELPEEVSHWSAAIWAAGVLLRACVEHGWLREEMGEALVTLVASTLAATAKSDDEIVADLRDALTRARAHTATKQ